MKGLKPDEWGGFEMCFKWNCLYGFLYAKTCIFLISTESTDF